MEILLVRELINGVSQGKKDVITVCLLLLIGYRFFKFAKFAYVEIKEKDKRISQQDERIAELERLIEEHLKEEEKK